MTLRLLFCCLLCAAAFTTPVLAQSGNTFLKAVTNVKRGYCMCPSGDGNLYVAGIVVGRQVILKMTPNGDILETYALNFTAGSFDPISELIVDSEGMVVGCGYINDTELGIGYIFRYNPLTHNILWYTGLEEEVVNFKGIIEKSPGGNFLVYGQACDPGQCDGLLLEVDRQTGLYSNIGLTNRYRQGRTAGFNAMVMHDSSLYAVGLAGDLSTGFVDYTIRSALTRLDTTHGTPLWTRLSGAPLEVSARLIGKDLIVDDNHLLTLYSGNRNDYAQPSTTFFLQKHRLDGTVEWRTEFDLTDWENEQAEEIIAVPDGYILYGSASHDDESSLFVVKTDKEGGPVWGRKLKYGHSTRFFNGVPQQGQILALDNHLFFTATTQGVNEAMTQMLLMKVSLDGEMTDSCDYWTPIPLIASELIDFPDTLFVPAVSPEVYNVVPNGSDPPYPIIANVVTNCQQAVLPPQPFADTCQQAKTFLKYYGQPGTYDWGLVLCAAHDGSVYAAGLNDGKTFLMRLNSGGGALWTRAFEPVPFYRTYLSSLIEDSEGMLVGWGMVGEGDFGERGYAFRYDPVADTLLWSKIWTGDNPQGGDLLEKNPGGNFLVCMNPHIGVNVDNAQFWELDRLTGDLVGGTTKHYHLGASDKFAQMAIHEGALYTIGQFSTEPSGAPNVFDKVRSALTRFDLATGLPVWSRLSHVDSSANAYLQGQALVIENQAIYSLINGTDTLDQPGKWHLFLQKNTLDGDLLWVKKYNGPADLSLTGQSIVPVADGFLIFSNVSPVTSDSLRGRFVLKVDKEGNVLWAKFLTKSSVVFNAHQTFGPHSAVLADGRAWFIATSFPFPGDVLILKMDPDGQVSDSCALLQPLAITATPVVAAVNVPIEVTALIAPGLLTDAPGATVPIELPAATYCLRCATICTETLDLGPDVVLCHDSTVTFHAGSGFVSYLWQDGSIDSTFTTDAYGLYWVEVTDACGQKQRDSVLLTVSLLGDTPFPDTALCTGETLTLSVPGFDQYQWTPAAALNCDTCATVVLQPTGPTEYTVLATTLNGCVFRDTFLVAGLPTPVDIRFVDFAPGDTVIIDGFPYTQPGTVEYISPATVGCDTLVIVILQFPLVCTDTLDLGPDVVLCRDSTVTFHAGSGFAAYLWQDGSTDSTFTTNAFGLYSVEVTDACGQKQRDSVLLTVSLLGDTPFPDTSICAGKSLTASAPGFDQYLWTPAAALNCSTCASVLLQPVVTTAYTLFASTAAGCSTRDTFIVTVLPLPTRTEVIEFAPGDTVVLGGVPYTQVGTVILTLPATAGCDTVVSYQLQLRTMVSLSCPANLTVSVQAGDPGTVVDYSFPTASTNCPDSTLTFTLLSGLPVGGVFPVGGTEVCYRVSDACGNVDSCCFQLTVEEQAQPCDVKTIGCLRYELLSIHLDAQGNRRYRIRVTNTCTNALVYTAFELPGSLNAVAPADGSVFTGASGRSYDVRNPNASPFHSIRFKARPGTLLNLGASDVFEFSLPSQTAPNYIHVTARLEPDQTYPALLNTFYCPVQPYPNFGPGAGNKQAASTFSVFPNPNDGRFFAACPAWAGQAVEIRIINVQGQLVHNQNFIADYAPSRLDLPEALADGIYFIELHTADGQRAVQRFVLQR